MKAGPNRSSKARQKYAVELVVFPAVNPVGIVLATVASFVIGGIWYAPPVLGKVWMRLVGMSADQTKALALGFLANPWSRRLCSPYS